MTTRQWQIIAAFAVVAAFVVLIAAVMVKDRAERSAKTAADSLATITLKLDKAEALARAGLTQTATYKRQVDSIWAVANARRDSIHRRPLAQSSFVLDVRDTLHTIQVIQTLTRERDEAIEDSKVAWIQVAAERALADQLRVAAIDHARLDSTRFTQIAAVLDTTQHAVHQVIATIRPRWYRRYAGNVITGTKYAIIAALSFRAGQTIR